MSGLYARAAELERAYAKTQEDIATGLTIELVNLYCRDAPHLEIYFNTGRGGADYKINGHTVSREVYLDVIATHQFQLHSYLSEIIEDIDTDKLARALDAWADQTLPPKTLREILSAAKMVTP